MAPRASALQGGEALAREGRFLGLGEIVHQVLQTSLGDRRLFQLDERQGFLVERRRDAVPSGIVRDDLSELLHRALERFARALRLSGVGVLLSERDLALTDPVLRTVGLGMVGIAAQELSKSIDGQRVASLAEIDIRRLVEILRL